MTSLIEEIRRVDEDAACTLERADCLTDSEITSLTREDLIELLPGVEKFQLRKKVFEIIQIRTKKPIDDILKELKSFIPDEQLRVTLNGDGALFLYLNILKEIKGLVSQIQTFTDAQISQLEGFQERQDQERIIGASSHHGSQTSSTGHPQQTHVTVMNKVIVTGKTLGAHEDVLKQLGKDFIQDQNLFRLHLENVGDVEHHRVNIVFCPVVSRLESDVESAMSQVVDDKDIILVVMHHSREAKTSMGLRSWSRPKRVVLDVNVFFHDTVGGLLSCKPNDDAVSQIQRKLLDYHSHVEKIQIIENIFSNYWKKFFEK